MVLVLGIVCCIRLLRLLQQNTMDGAAETTDLRFSRFWGWKSKLKVLAGLVRACFLACGWLPSGSSQRRERKL